MIQEALVTLINDRVTMVSGRITPILRADNAPLPAITYQSGQSTQERDLDGSSSGIKRTVIELDLWADTYAEIKAIEQQVFELDGFTGTVGGQNIGYIRVSASGDDLDADPDIQTTALTLNITTTG